MREKRLGPACNQCGHCPSDVLAHADYSLAWPEAVDLRLPTARVDPLARLHRDGTVREVEYDDEFTTVVATIPTRSLEVFAAFLRCQSVILRHPSSHAYLPS